MNCSLLKVLLACDEDICICIEFVYIGLFNYICGIKGWTHLYVLYMLVISVSLSLTAPICASDCMSVLDCPYVLLTSRLFPACRYGRIPVLSAPVSIVADQLLLGLQTMMEPEEEMSKPLENIYLMHSFTIIPSTSKKHKR